VLDLELAVLGERLGVGGEACEKEWGVMGKLRIEEL